MIRLSAISQEPRVVHVQIWGGALDFSSMWLGRRYHQSGFTIRVPGIEKPVSFVLYWCCANIAVGALPTNDLLAQMGPCRCGTAGTAPLSQFNESHDPTSKLKIPQDLMNDDWEDFLRLCGGRLPRFRREILRAS